MPNEFPPKPHTFKPPAERHPLPWVTHELDRAYPLVGQLDRLLFAQPFDKITFTHDSFVHAPLKAYDDENFTFGAPDKTSKFKYANVEIAAYPQDLKEVKESDITRKIIVRQTENGKKHVILEGRNPNGASILATIEIDMIGNERDGYKPVQKLIGIGVSGSDSAGEQHAAYIYPSYNKETKEFSANVEVLEEDGPNGQDKSTMYKGDEAKKIANIEKFGENIGFVQVRLGNAQVMLPIPLDILDQQMTLPKAES